MPARLLERLLQAGELAFEFYRASGPGGQNVNRVSTAARLRFDLRRSRVLAPPVKERLARLAGRRLTDAGELILEAQRHRTQERNRQEALQRLLRLLAAAQEAPRPRRPTGPTAAGRERRLAAKKRRRAVKALRRPPAAE